MKMDEKSGSGEKLKADIVDGIKLGAVYVVANDCLEGRDFIKFKCSFYDYSIQKWRPMYLTWHVLENRLVTSQDYFRRWRYLPEPLQLKVLTTMLATVSLLHSRRVNTNPAKYLAGVDQQLQASKPKEPYSS